MKEKKLLHSRIPTDGETWNGPNALISVEQVEFPRELNGCVNDRIREDLSTIQPSRRSIHMTRSAAEPALARALEVALEDAHVNQRRIAPIRPEILRAETHVVRGLVLGVDAVGVRIGKGIRG